MLALHAESGADMTVSCMSVPLKEAAGSFGVMSVDSADRIVAFQEKPEHPEPLPDNREYCLASMGNYIFKTEFLFDQLKRDSLDPDSDHDFGKNIIPNIIADNKVQAYRFSNPDAETAPYWRDVGTLDSYWLAHMELAYPVPPLDLYDQSWPIWTFQEQLPPAKFVFDDEDRRGEAIDSMVAGGVIISGATVRKSVLFSNVRVHSFANINQCVILPDVTIGRRSKLHKVIIDRGCVIPENTEIGIDHDADRAKGYRVTEQGVTLVTRKLLGNPEGS